MAESAELPKKDRQQPLLHHLLELRARLLNSLIAVLVVFVGLCYFANPLYLYLAEPLIARLPAGSTMIATEVASPFLAPFKLTLIVALFIAMPLLLHHLWAFISPGLYRHEKRLAIPLLIASTALFYLGVGFAYFVVFPLLFAFFTTVGPDSVKVMTDINHYLDFVLKLFVGFGMVFEIPIATLLLVWSGMTTTEHLRQKRPYVVVGCFIVGMLLTPPDVISQTLLAVPMWLLFEAGLLLTRCVARRQPQWQDGR